jgi:hypothetical protein
MENTANEKSAKINSILENSENEKNVFDKFFDFSSEKLFFSQNIRWQIKIFYFLRGLKNPLLWLNMNIILVSIYIYKLVPKNHVNFFCEDL